MRFYIFLQKKNEETIKCLELVTLLLLSTQFLRQPMRMAVEALRQPHALTN
jgi:hypothetical protein